MLGTEVALADALILLFILGLMVVVFITERMAVDATAMAAVLILVLCGYLTPHEAFSGFSSPVVIVMVSTLFLSCALKQTGISDALARWMLRWAAGSERVAIAVVVVISALVSACMNNVSAAALLMPAVAVLSLESGIAPSRLFMPLAYGVTFGGTLTLIGTPPNIVASELLHAKGLQAFSFFDFTPFGLVVVTVGVIFFVVLAPRLLPMRKTQQRTRRITDLNTLYHLHERLFSLRVPGDGPVVGQSLSSLRFAENVGGLVVTIIRGGRKLLSPRPDEKLEARDVLLVRGSLDGFHSVSAQRGLIPCALPHEVRTKLSEEAEIVRVTIRRVSTESQTLSLRALHERSGIVPLAMLDCKTLLGADVPRSLWFLDTVVGPGDSFLGCITRHFAEDPAELDLKVELVSNPAENLYKSLHAIKVEKGWWGGAPLRRLIHETHLPVLARIEANGNLAWVDLPDGSEKESSQISICPADHSLRDEEIYLVGGELKDAELRQVLAELGLESESAPAEYESEEIGIVELVLTPRSELIGRSLADLHFREKYEMQVLALWRDGRPLRTISPNVSLGYGDALLVQGPRSRFPVLGKDPDVLLLSEFNESPQLSYKSWFAIIALALLIILPLVFDFPVHEAAFLSAVLVIVTGTIRTEQAYREIEWRVVFLLAFMIPLGIAVEHSGVPTLLAAGLKGALGGVHPSVITAALIILASLISQGIDGVLAVVLLGPVALALGEGTEYSRTWMMAIALGASLSFMLHVSSRANVLVMGAGGYRPSDFLRVGSPITILLIVVLTLVLTVLEP